VIVLEQAGRATSPGTRVTWRTPNVSLATRAVFVTFGPKTYRAVDLALN
jgi:hypothetical protein